MFGTGSKVNASNSVPVALEAASFRVSWCTVQAGLTNTGTIEITGPLSTSTGGFFLVNPGDSFVIWSPASLHLGIDLAEVFILPSVAGDGVTFSYVR